MAQGSHSADTVWFIVEPDMCMYKIDGASRLELVQGSMPAEVFKDYEESGASIQDPNAKKAFMENFEIGVTSRSPLAWSMCRGLAMLTCQQLRIRSLLGDNQSLRRLPPKFHSCRRLIRFRIVIRTGIRELKGMIS